jgi:hypothetical protein
MRAWRLVSGEDLRLNKVLLSANLSAHEDDVGNAETDRHQGEQCGDMGPDQGHALIKG